jgi:hypothetical protein
MKFCIEVKKQTPLMFAVHLDDFELVHWLVEEVKVDVNEP